jgi:hypothetical protein
MTDSEKKFRRDKASKIEKIVHAMADLISERGTEYRNSLSLLPTWESRHIEGIDAAEY